MTSMPTREGDLTAEERLLLEGAHRRLRDAVAAYQTLTAVALEAGAAVPAQDPRAVAAAQAEVEEAERELWKLRARVLGWVRPSWAPSAVFEADWFSDEDAVYDAVTAGPVP